MKKIFFTLIMASSAFLCAQSYEQTNIMLDPFYEVKEDNQEHSMLDITKLESLHKKKKRHNPRKKHCRNRSSENHSNQGEVRRMIHGFFTSASDSIIPTGGIVALEVNHVMSDVGVSLLPDGRLQVTDASEGMNTFAITYAVSANAAGSNNDSSIALFIEDLTGAGEQLAGTRVTLNQDFDGISTGLSGNTAQFSVPGPSFILAIRNIDQMIQLNPVVAGNSSVNLSIVRFGRQ